jgi:hypothetical protein
MKTTAVSLIVAVLAVSAAAVAQAPAPPVTEPQLPPQYEVEILVFENLNFDPTEERFEATPDGFADDAAALREVPVFDDTNFGPLAPVNVVPPQPVDPLAAQLAEALRIRPLKPEELKLGNEFTKLRASAAYRPLVHAGWVQPGLPEADAEPFDFKMLGLLNPRGTVRVHLSRFLHITLDLTYQADGTLAPGVTAADGLDELVLAPRYHLVAERNARSNELHYFDHPAFGVLVRVTPLPAQDASGRRPAA